MIRFKINGVDFQLPASWDELPDPVCLDILELREQKMPLAFFYFRALKLLLGIPSGPFWQLLYFLSNWKPVFLLLKKCRPQIWAKMMFLRFGEEADKLDVLRWLDYLQNTPVFTRPPDFSVDLARIQNHLKIHVDIVSPDKDGRRLTFEQLLDGFIFFQKFFDTKNEAFLHQLIASLYCYTDGRYQGMYTELLSHEMAGLRPGLKTRILLWYQHWYSGIVKDHPEVFKKKEEDGEEDPYGLVGFMHRISGGVANLQTTKDTPGIEALDNIEIRIFDQKNRKTEALP